MEMEMQSNDNMIETPTLTLDHGNAETPELRRKHA